MGLTQAQATVASGAIQGGSQLFGQILGTIIGGVQARRMEKNADEWNNKMLEREDKQNRFSNLVTMKGLDQRQQIIDESKKIGNASLYQNQFQKMLSTVNSNALLKKLVTQNWGGK